MKNIIRSLIFSIITSNVAYAQLSLNTTVERDEKKLSITERFLNKVSFQYFVQYTGPSLSQDYQQGATYNRFSGGSDVTTGQRLDTTSSQQVYQAFSLGFKLPKNMNLSYGISYQDNIKKNIRYQGVYREATRDYGRTFNDHQISLWVPNIVTGKKMSLSSTFIYQIPTTKISKENELNYTLGVQPALIIYSQTPGLYHGLTASLQKSFYNKDYYSVTNVTNTYYKYNPDGSRWVNPDGTPMLFTNRYQQIDQLSGVYANVGAYLNYTVTNRITLKSSVQLDWNQVGKQVGTWDQWSNNLDNIGNLGAAYLVKNGVNFEGGINFSLDQLGLDRTALFGSLSLSI